MRVKGGNRGVGQGDDCTEHSEAVVDQGIEAMMEQVLVKPVGAEKLMGARC